MVITALPVSAMAEYGTEVAKSVPGIMDKVWEGWRDQWLGQLAGRISGRPAQKMQAEAVDGAFVKIDAPNLALPAGTEVRVVKLDDEGMDKVQAIIGNTPGVNVKAISAYDITFFCNGKEIEPNGSVSVDMSLLGIEEGKGVSIYHIDSKASDLDNGMTCEKVENVELNEGVASFKADSFSIYFVSNAQTTGILKVEFYDTNGKFLNAQAVRLSDFEVKDTPIYDPGLKILPDSDGTDFSGWAEVESENDTVSESDAMVIDEVNNLIKEHFVDYLADNVVKFKATNITLGYAKFYALNHNIVALKNIKLDNNTLEGTVNFNVEYKNPLTEYRTVGWVEDKYVKISGVDSGVMDNDVMDNDVMDNDVMDDGHIGPPEYLTDEEGYRVYTLDQIVTMSFDNESRMLEFYPYIESGFWLSFNNNESYTNTVNGFDGSSWNYTEGAEANDIAPVFCNDGITAGKQPTAPTREGYTFGGWYNDKACTEAFDWGVIDKETVVYAKWTPATAKFNITVWIEKVPETDFDGNFTKDPVYEYYTTMDYTGVGTAAVYSLERAAEDMLEIVNAENASNSGNTQIIPIYSPVDEHYFYLDRAKNNDFTAKVRGDGKSVINFYFRRHEITLNIRAVKNYTTLKSITTAEALTGAYKNRALYGKPAGSDYYEALTRVDGKIYLKKGLFMDSDNSNQQVMSPNAQEYTGDLYVINKDSSQYSEFPNYLNTNFGYADYYSVEKKYGDILLQFKGRYGQFFSYWPDYDFDSTFVYWSYNTGNNRYSPLGLNQFLDGNGYQGNVSDYVYDMIPYARAMYNSSSSAVIYAYQDFMDYEVEVEKPGHPNETIQAVGITDWYDMPFYSYLNTNEIQNVGGARAEDFNFDHLSYCWPYGSGNNATSVVENPVIEYNGTNWFQEAEENHNVQPNGPSIGATQYDYNCQLGDGNWKTNMEIFVVRTRNLHAMHYFIDGQEIKPFPGDRPLLYQEGNNDPITQRQSIYHNYSPNIMDYMMDIVVKGDDYSAALDAGDGSFDWDSAGMDEKLFFCNAEPQPNDIPADKHFVGWYKDYSLQEPFDFDERIQSDTAAYARLDPDHYRVVLHYDTVKKADSTFTYLDSSEPTTVVLDAGEQIFDNELSWQNGVWTDKDGKTYLFRGWFYDSKFQNPVSREATAISAFADMSYHIGSGVDACTNLSYEDVEEDYIAGKIDLYALFTEAKHNVSGVQLRYDAVDGDGSFSNDAIIRMDEYVYVYGSEARIGSASTADDEDYAFDHWVLLDKEGNPTDYVYYPGDIFTITDQYAVSGVQITYNYKIGPLGDQTSITDFTTYGEIPTPPAAATRAYIAGGAYYEFDHWEPELAPATEITSYTAVYKAPAPIPHVNVYFHTNLDPDQTIAEVWEFADSNAIVNEFEDVFPSVTIPAGKVCVGWSFKQTGAEEADCITDLTIEENRDYDIYAVWANAVTFEPGTGNGEIIEDITFSDTEFVIPEDTFGFYKPNWTFDGWKINGTGTTYYAGDKISNPTFPLVLVAQWLEGYTVTYNNNGGSGSIDSVLVPVGSQLEVVSESAAKAAFTRTGYTLTGFNSAADGSGTAYAFGGTYNISANTTLYAVWSANPFTVSFDKNGGSGTMSNDTVYYDQDYHVPNNGFSAPDADQKFSHWTVGSTTYNPDDTIHITGDVTLTANWKNKDYQIILNPNGGSGSAQTYAYRDAGNSITLPANASGYFTAPSGMGFKCWSINGTEYNGGGNYTVDASHATNNVITISVVWQYAKFVPVTISNGFTFDPNKKYAFGYLDGSTLKLVTSNLSGVRLEKIDVNYSANGTIIDNDAAFWKFSGGIVSNNPFTVQSLKTGKYITYGGSSNIVMGDSSYQFILNGTGATQKKIRDKASIYVKLCLSSNNDWGLYSPSNDNQWKTITFLVQDTSTSGNVLPAPESAVLDVETKAEEKAVETTVEKTVEMTEAPVAKTSENREMAGEYPVAISGTSAVETRTALEPITVEAVKVETKKPSVETKDNDVMGPDVMVNDVMDAENQEKMVITFRAVYSPKVTDDDGSRIVFNANGLSFTNNAIGTIESANAELNLDWNIDDNSFGDFIASSEVEYNNKGEATIMIPGPEVFEQNGQDGYRLIGWNTQPDGSGVEILFSNITASEDQYDAKFASGANTLPVYIDNLDKSEGGKLNTSINTLYAMWEGYTAFYHSADNTIEPNHNDGVKYGGNEVGGTLVYSTYAGVDTTVDIPGLVPEGSLYGGYYKDYAGKGSYSTFAVTDGVTGAVAYDGANADWDIEDAKRGTENRGDRFTVEKDEISEFIGKTIYIKEVPAAKYLRLYSYCTYNRNDKTIRSWWLITDTDDKNYQQTGFIIDGVVTPCQSWPKSVRITPKNADPNDTETGAKTLSQTTFNAPRAWVPYKGYREDSNNTGSFEALENKTYTNYWITLDNILVIGTRQRTFGSDISNMNTAPNNLTTGDYTGVKYYYTEIVND